MNTIRARRIAEAFSPISAFGVRSSDHGICVNYLGNQAYFVRESAFWPFVFKLGQVNHEEGQIAEIEMSMHA